MAIKIPDDLNAPSDPQSLKDPISFAPPPNLDPASFNLQGKKSKLPLILVAVVVVAGGGFGGYRMITGRNKAKLHASFMEHFAAVEKDDVGAFWACVIGPNQDPGLFGDNEKFGQKIEAMFNADAKAYPDKLVDDCVPRLQGIASKAQHLGGPSDYDEALAKYGKTVDALGEGAKDWAEGAKKRIPEREADKRVEQAGVSFHSAAPNKAGTDAIGYDRFLRCAVPDLDKLKDEQALLQRLFNDCKKPDFVQKARFECSKLAGQTEVTKEDKSYKASWKKFAPDDRDVQAFSDCFRKGRKGGKKDDMQSFGRAYVDYMQASGEVRKIGAANLKEE